MTQKVVVENFTDYVSSVNACMTAAGAVELFETVRPVMLKPNLVNASPHPVTTPPAFCAAVIDFIRQHTDAPIVVAEGCGDMSLDTLEVFARTGYSEMARDLGVALLDLNTAPLKALEDAQCRRFPKMWLPEAAFEHVLISLPVLKAHSLCRLTGSMKNMMGLAPPERFGGQYGSWKKAAFHDRLDEAIVDLNRYRSPDFTVMDATVGLIDYHLGGACCDPPANRILASSDARELDRMAAGLLGMGWHEVGHLRD